MTDGFNLQDSEDDVETLEEQREEKKKEFQNQSDTYNLSDGLNVLHVVPAIGETFEHIVYKSIHFQPFHICGRPDPVPNTNAENGFEKGGNFSDCYRCLNAWERWEEKGKPRDQDDPNYIKFQQDMANDRAVMQVVDFSPFFGWKNSKKKNLVEPKMDVVDKWLKPFLELVLSDEEDVEVPEEMPEEMVEAAENCPAIMNVSIFSVGQHIMDEFEQTRDLKETDPFGRPNRFMLTVHRTNSGQTFQTASGEVQGKDYRVDFTKEDLMGDWKERFPLESYMKKLAQKAVDIENMEPEVNEDGEVTLESRAFALEKLSNDEMKEYLGENDHSFEPDTSFDPENMEGDGEGEASSEEPPDPDDFGEQDEDVMTLDDVEDEELDEELEDL